MECFAAAKKQYSDFYLQVKNINVAVPGSANPVKVKGQYDEPGEQKKFAVSLFSIGNDETVYKNVKVEVALQYIIKGWQVSIYVYDKIPDDEILPDVETKNDY